MTSATHALLWMIWSFRFQSSLTSVSFPSVATRINMALVIKIFTHRPHFSKSENNSESYR
jgi:hypothetical protein